MREIFSKYNRNYREEFQLSTHIYKDQDRYIVSKKALNENAKEHLFNMKKSYDNLKNLMINISMCPCNINNDSIDYEYIQGSSLTKKIFDILKKNDKIEYENLILSIMKLFETTKDNITNFQYTENFIAIFGKEYSIEGVTSYKKIVYDITSNNIIIDDEDKYFLIDYEWYFDFPVPVELVKFHFLNTLYNNNPIIEEFYSLSSILEKVGFELDYKVLIKLEKNYFEHIITYNNYKYITIKNKYLKDTDYSSDNQISKSLDWHKNKVKELEGAIKYHKANDIELENRNKETIKELEWHKNRVLQLEGAIKYHRANDIELENRNKETIKELEWHKNRVLQLEGAIKYHVANDIELENRNKETIKELEWHKCRVSQLEEAIEYHQANDIELENKMKILEEELNIYRNKCNEMSISNSQLNKKIFEYENTIYYKLYKKVNKF